MVTCVKSLTLIFFPACSPVLLPSWVVQALNLNVHELGLQISPRRGLPLNLYVYIYIYIILIFVSDTHSYIHFHADPRNNTCTRRGDLNKSLNNNSNNGNKNGKDHASTKRCVVPQSETSSADIFLPREWTY